jgi:tetratricopeptide (TPR) repeat protein
LHQGIAWRKACDLRRAFEAFDQALALDPNLVEARLARAEVLENRDVGAALEEYAAVAALAPSDPRPYLNSASLREAAGDHISALGDLQQALSLADEQGMRGTRLRSEIVRSRAGLYNTMGFVHGALADSEYIANTGMAPSNGRASDEQLEVVRNKARLHWRSGRFDHALQGFSDLIADAGTRKRPPQPIDLLWRCLAGARSDPARARADLIAARPESAAPDAIRVSRTGAASAWEPLGPPCPTARWPEVAIELFCGRIGPERYGSMADHALKVSDRWQRPLTLRGVGITDVRPPKHHLWRAEVDFYLGQWHLIEGDIEAARAALTRTATDGRTGCFEHHAARTELSRLGSGAVK